jgi:cyanophycin synthetase
MWKAIYALFLVVIIIFNSYKSSIKEGFSNENYVQRGDKITIKRDYFKLKNPDSVRKYVNNKYVCKNILQKNGLPVPKAIEWNYDKSKCENLNTIFSNLSFPLVLKPINGQSGYKVFVGLENKSAVMNKLGVFLDNKRPFLVEEQAFGNNYRVFVMNGKVLDIVRRDPPFVIGDGESTMLELIQEDKRNNEFGIKKPDWSLIKKQGFTRNMIVPNGQKIIVTLVIHYTNGSKTESLNLQNVHPENIDMFVKANKILNLHVSGIDYMGHDLSVPFTLHNGRILEVNPGPGLDIHRDLDKSFMNKFIRNM